MAEVGAPVLASDKPPNLTNYYGVFVSVIFFLVGVGQAIEIWGYRVCIIEIQWHLGLRICHIWLK